MRDVQEFPRKVPSEWKYFQEYARRFDSNKKAQRYGILPMNEKPKEENMLYASDPLELRIKHIRYLINNPRLLDNTIEGFRSFLDWLEVAEGKKPRTWKSKPGVLDS